jgi:hypothetical protein
VAKKSTGDQKEKMNAWTMLQWNRLLQRPRHMKERIIELNQLFERFHRIANKIKCFNGAKDQASKSYESSYRSIIAQLLKVASKRAHPRIGVLSTAAEGIFEKRCLSKWSKSLIDIKNDCMELEVKLKLTKNISYEV